MREYISPEKAVVSSEDYYPSRNPVKSMRNVTR